MTAITPRPIAIVEGDASNRFRHALRRSWAAIGRRFAMKTRFVITFFVAFGLILAGAIESANHKRAQRRTLHHRKARLSTLVVIDGGSTNNSKGRFSNEN